MGTRKYSPNCFWTKGIVEIVVDKKYPAPIRMLIEMMRASTFPRLKAVALDGRLPVARSQIAERSDIHTRRRGPR